MNFEVKYYKVLNETKHLIWNLILLSITNCKNIKTGNNGIEI